MAAPYEACCLKGQVARPELRPGHVDRKLPRLPKPVAYRSNHQFRGFGRCGCSLRLRRMAQELSNHRVAVTFVGPPPARQITRASGVTEVEVDGHQLRCLVCGSFQPLLEALRGYEVIYLTSIPTKAGD